MTKALPQFENPPVVEAALSVQFKPMSGWTIPHFGLFWQGIRQSLPEINVLNPIQAQSEDVEKPPFLSLQWRVEPVTVPEVRCWFASQDKHRLIQLQNDRFVFNWRKLDSNLDYPRYKDFVRPTFETYWQRFLSFLVQENLGIPSVNQCEMTYVNHIKRNEGWTTIDEWDQVFNVVRKNHPAEFLPPPELEQFNLSYLMPDKAGRLRVEANPVIRKSDGNQAIAFSLVARGCPQSTETNDILAWFDLGREWIVRGFTDLTTPKMHQLWRRTQ